MYLWELNLSFLGWTYLRCTCLMDTYLRDTCFISKYIRGSYSIDTYLTDTYLIDTYLKDSYLECKRIGHWVKKIFLIIVVTTFGDKIGVYDVRWESNFILFTKFLNWLFNYRLRNQRWSRSGLRGCWASCARTLLRSVAKTLSSLSPEKSRQSVFSQIQVSML